jgi:hypothetical protein
MNWREFISDIYATLPPRPGIASRAAFQTPASLPEIANLEARLDAKIPSSLRTLLLETNGVMDMLAIDEGEWFDNWWLIWPTAQLIDENLRLRAASEQGTYKRAFHELLVFAGAGVDGILFAHPIAPDRAALGNVLVWHALEDRLTEMAPSLEDFLKGWLSGSLSV